MFKHFYKMYLLHLLHCIVLKLGSSYGPTAACQPIVESKKQNQEQTALTGSMDF